MNNTETSQVFQRAILLHERGRLEDAESYFKEAISTDPDNCEIYAELALCQVDMDGRSREALQSIKNAIRLDPEVSDYHAIKAIALGQLEYGKKALKAADEAITLDSANPMAHAAKALAHLVLQNWKKAEGEARQALSLEPDYTFAENILILALRLQGNKKEGMESIDKLLSDDPENAFAHCNAGWIALKRSDHKTAELHFREALRIDAQIEDARDGLVESLKARSPFFRVFQRYCFFMESFRPHTRFMIIFGSWLLFKFGGSLLARIHPMVALVPVTIFLIFYFWSWLASGVANFFIFLDRSARFALNRSEVTEGLFVGGGSILGIILLIVGFVTPFWLLLIPGASLLFGAIPANLTFTNDSRIGRYIFGTVMTLTYSLGLLTLITSLWESNQLITEIVSISLGVCFLGCILCTWLANIRRLRVQA